MITESAVAAVALLATIVAAVALGLRARERRRRTRLTAAIAESEARYRALVERLPAMVYLAEFGEQGRWTYVSSQVEDLLGYTPEEWVANRGLWVERLHPADREQALEAEARIRESGEPYRCEYRMIARDGGVIWIRDEAAVIFEDGHPILQGFMYDISEKKHTEELLHSRHRDVEATVRRRTLDLEESRLEILRRLALPAEYRDDASHQHTERVGRTAAMIARRLDLPEDFVRVIRRAAPLHDVGKIGVPDSILLKPGRLTAEEFTILQDHAKIGRRILSGSKFDVLQMAEEIAFSHHERWDGTGYPVGLVAGEIPISGRITALADVFDALTHHRPYKQAWSAQDAVAEVLRLSGSHFDPAVVEAFMGLDHARLLEPIQGVIPETTIQAPAAP